MDAGALRPLGVGEILDAGIKIYRRRFGALVRAVAVVVIPVSALSGVINLSVGNDASSNFDGGDAAALGAVILSSLIGIVASQLATVASFEIVAGDYLDRAPTWRDSLSAARRWIWPALWLTLVLAVFTGLGFVLCVLPGIYLFAAFAVAFPVLLFEDVRGTKALRRSRELIRGRWWPTFGVLVVSYILTGIVSSAIQGVLFGVVNAGGDVADAVASSVAGALSSILVTPFTAAVVTVLYFDARVRKEGFDLELMARRIGVEPPVGAADLFLPPARPVDAPDEPPFWPPPPGWRAGRPQDE